MKKKIVMGIICVGVLVACYFIYKAYEGNNDNYIVYVDSTNNNIELVGTYNKGNIYTVNSYVYLYYNEIIKNVSLKFAIEENMIDIKNLTDFLTIKKVDSEEGYTLYSDNGSSKRTNGNLRVLKCNTVSGNKDIYIGDTNLEYKYDLCK